ncbi:hypothetical protein BD626DRAFT_635296 [Schizophyllum amplum]|uniref:Uncharacterized protein n=1 Tax=Schizophyllum amplum TaxID=97359 RepID=A0A550BWG3_9AGAR|nr:hypothetical protein BD626DRAFT_635296 [Auriculariopsis ampla]
MTAKTPMSDYSFESSPVLAYATAAQYCQPGRVTRRRSKKAWEISAKAERFFNIWGARNHQERWMPRQMRDDVQARVCSFLYDLGEASVYHSFVAMSHPLVYYHTLQIHLIVYIELVVM